MKQRITFYDVIFENIGVQVLSALLRREGYAVQNIYIPNDTDPLHLQANIARMVDEAVKDILESAPEVVCFSVYTLNYQLYREIACQLKKISPELCIIFGGIHVTLTGASILEDDFVDYAVAGEGEKTLLELLVALSGNGDLSSIPNLIHRTEEGMVGNPLRPYLTDLDALPFPDKKLYVEKNPYLGARYHVLGSRGCLFKCAYCSNNVFAKLYSEEKCHIRQRSPENVIAELEMAVREYAPLSIYFMDDLFTYNKKWLRELAELYRDRIGLPSDCLTHPAFVDDHIIQSLKMLNTKLVILGVQTADEEYRERVLKRKGTNERIGATIARLKSEGFEVSIDHIFGLPGESRESLVSSVDKYLEWAPTHISKNWLAYYPRTDIVTYAYDNGYLTDEDLRQINAGTHDYNHTTLPREERRFYQRYLILFMGIGVLPRAVMRFFNRHPSFIPPLGALSSLLQALSHIVVHRKAWTLSLLKFRIKTLFEKKSA